jgi:amino acid transporter/ubiquinone/menaquinone biosynthesis C-methylase UbiE
MSKLKKVLNYPTILLITINSIMGTGIFFLPAIGAMHAGPASIISWIVLSFIAIYIAMVFGELSSMYPKSGGIYEFCKQAYGRFFSFIVGWTTFIAGNITIGMLVVGAIQYLLPVDLPFVKIGLSLFFILVFNYIAFKGMKTSAVMLVTFAFITLGTLIALIIPSLFKFQTANMTPFFVSQPFTLFFVIFLIAETFFGWETATFLAAETKNGEKVMPKALIWGTVIIAGICIIFVSTSLGAIPWQQFGNSVAPLTDLGKLHFGNFGGDAFTLLVYLAIIGSVAGWIVSAPRLILAMAQDKLFLRQFAKIHPKHGTPYKAIILQTIITSIVIFVGAGSYDTLLLILVPLVLFMYAATMLSVVVLRYKQPKTKRYFKVPFGRTGPILVVLFLISLIITWIIYEHSSLRLLTMGASFIIIGIPLYFLIEFYYDPKMIRRVDDLFATLVLLGEGVLFPKPVRREVMRLLGNIKGKSVLEFGCSVGTLTEHLAEEVGPKGKVYATNMSHHEAKIAARRMEKHKHVKVIHDPQHHSRVHPDVPKVHTVVSVGMLGMIQNKQKVLKGLNRKLKIGSKICFVDYDKFFDVIPNIEWVRDEIQLKHEFEKAGFDIKVKKRQGFAWKYIYIFGNKVKNV